MHKVTAMVGRRCKQEVAAPNKGETMTTFAADSIVMTKTLGANL